MENIVCQLCHQLCDEPMLLQCKYHICSKCVQTQPSFELLHTPCDQFPLNTEYKQKEGKQEIDDEEETANICCPVCNEKTILLFSQGNIKLSNNQQLSVDNDGLGENQQQQQYIPDEMLQWVFQFLDAKESFTKIRFTSQRVDKIVCTSLLSLRCQGLLLHGLKFIHEILPKQIQLQELNLMANNIGDNEATQIVSVFPSIWQLKMLNLSWNQIGTVGATAIANSVTYLNQLQWLDISCNPIEDSGIIVISNATKELTKFQKLDISEKYSKKVHKKVQQMFSTKRTKLDLTHCNIDDASAITLATIVPHLTHLQVLNLYNNQIEDTGAIAIANCIRILTQFQQLDLCGNRIGDIGATAIANAIKNLTQLRELDLGINQIGNTGAIAIANTITNLSQLQQLHLGSNQIEEAGAAVLANSLTNLTQLQRLHLGGNQIGDIGATAISNTISNLTRLNCWSIRNNNISKHVKQQLKQQFGDKLTI